MDLQTKPRIGVMGAGSCSPEVYKIAYEVGLLIAGKGGILICGGRSGVMEAAAKGAKEGGGITVGILPEDTAEGANRFIDIPIVTGLGNARNNINVLTSQAIIAIQGSYGTLSEIALALKWGTPVIGLGTWNLVSPIGERIPITVAHTPEEAVSAAFASI